MLLADLARANGVEGVTYRSSLLTEETWHRLLDETSNETFILARNSVLAFCRASIPAVSEVTATNYLLTKALDVKLESNDHHDRPVNLTSDLIVIYCIFMLAASTQPSDQAPLLPTLIKHFTRVTDIALAASKHLLNDPSLDVAASLLTSAIVNVLAHESADISKPSLARMVRASTRCKGELSEELVRSNRVVLEWAVKAHTSTDVPLADGLVSIIAADFAQLGRRVNDRGLVDRLTQDDWPSLLNTRDAALVIASLSAATSMEREIPLRLDIAVTLTRGLLTRLGLTETAPAIRERDLIKARPKLAAVITPCLQDQVNSFILFVQRMAEQTTTNSVANTLTKLAHIVRFSAVAQIDVRENVISAAERLVASCVQCEVGGSSECLEKSIIYLLGSLRTGHSHLSLTRFGRTLLQTLQAQTLSQVRFVCVATAYFDLLADSLSAGAREASNDTTHSETLRKARQHAVLNLQELVQTHVLACKDLAASTATTQSLADIGEGMESESRQIGSKGMGALLSCFGTEIVLAMKPCKLEPLTSPLDKKFLITSGMWILEAFQFTQGGLDLSTYFSFFHNIRDRLASKIKTMRELRMKERNIDKCSLELLYEAVSSQLESSLPHFCYYPADIDFLHKHDSLILDLMSKDYTIEQVSGVARSLGRLLKSLANSPDEFARPVFDRLWRPVRDWAEKASQSQVSEAGRNLLHVIASTIPTENIFELASHLLMSVARSNDTETREVFLDLTSIAVEAAVGRPEICASLEVISKAAIEQIAISNANMKGWLHLLSSLLMVFDSCTNFLETQTSTLMQVVAKLGETTPAPLWKTRLQFHNALLAHLSMLWDHNKILDDVSRLAVIDFLLKVPFYEACWKCSSMTGVTRRRAYRTLENSAELILRILGSNDGSREISRVLLCGMSVVECSEFQRGFVVAGEKLLCMDSLRFTSAFRAAVEEVLSVSKGLCHNLEKQSTRSSLRGSRISKSTRFTSRSIRSIKSHYKPRRS